MKRIFLIFVGLLFFVGCGKVVKEAKFELEGNPTTGFQWTCSDSKGIVSIDYNYKSNNENLDGSGGLYTFTVKGIKPGESVISCVYKRSWEETEFDNVKEYIVKVDNDLNVNLIEK